MQVVRYGGEQALRCLALAYRPWRGDQLEVAPEDEAELVFIALVGMQDPPRPEARPVQLAACAFDVVCTVKRTQPDHDCSCHIIAQAAVQV